MSIQEHLNKIRNAVYGREVRESIAKGIETAYDDASENGNANMEVKIARGTHPNLRSRLEEVDNKQQQTTAQLAQKVGLGTKAELEDLSANVLGAIEGGAGTSFNLLSIPQDKSVSPEKTTFFDVSTNLFNKENVLSGKRIDPETGELMDNANTFVSEKIPVTPQNYIMYGRNGRYVAYDENDVMIQTELTSSTSYTRPFTPTEEWAYIRIANTLSDLENTQLNEGDTILPYESYYTPRIKSSYIGFETPDYSGADIRKLDDFGAVGDGVTDDTQAIQDTLNAYAGTLITIPPKTFKITGSLVVKTGTHLVGEGANSRFILGDNYSLSSTLWRGEPFHYIIRTEENGTDITFEDFRLTGHKTEFQNIRKFGLGVIDSERVEVNNVWVDYINYFPEEAHTSISVLAWNLGIFRAKDVTVNGGRFEYGGYECVGTEDVENVTFDNIFSGVGWRTSLQLHRNSRNVKILHPTIMQNEPNAHSCLTLHGVVGAPVEDVKIIGGYIEGITDDSVVNAWRGGIQSVDYEVRHIDIINNTVKSTMNGVYIEETSHDWKVLGNTIIAGNYGIYGEPTAENLIIKDNIIDSVNTNIEVGTTNVLVKDNI